MYIHYFCLNILCHHNQVISLVSCNQVNSNIAQNKWLLHVTGTCPSYMSSYKTVWYEQGT